MTNHDQQAPKPSEAIVYQICIRGQLDHAWAEWFEGLQISSNPNGNSLLVGTIVDQAALYGLIKKIRDLGMHLISIMPLNSTILESNSTEQ